MVHGIAVADAVMILENSYYSVISPEGCAAILWKKIVRLHPKRGCAQNLAQIT